MGAGGSLRARNEGKRCMEESHLTPSSQQTTALPSLECSFQSEYGLLSGDEGSPTWNSHSGNTMHIYQSMDYPTFASEYSDCSRVTASTSMLACQRARLHQDCKDFASGFILEEKRCKRSKRRKHTDEPFFQSERSQVNDGSQPVTSFVSESEYSALGDTWKSEYSALGDTWKSECSTTEGVLRTRSTPSMVAKRRAQIHEFRLREELGHEKPGHEKTRHLHDCHEGLFKTSHTRSLPSLQKASKGGHEMVAAEDAWCGFKACDLVSPSDGPDAKGPWEGMGQGIVLALGSRKGYLVVSFQSSGESFSIKASNLTHIASRTKPTLGKLVKRSSTIGAIGRQSPTSKGRGTPKSRMLGLVTGDIVTDRSQGGNAKVLGEGSSPGSIQVRYVDLKCTRNAKMTDLVKIKSPGEKLQRACSGLQHEQPSAVVDHLRGLAVGDYVKVTCNQWAELGLGCIRGLGDKPGTLRVQFDSGGETWVINAEDLRKEAAPEKHFRAPGRINNHMVETQKQEEKLARRIQRREKERCREKEALASLPDTMRLLKDKVLENDQAEGHYQTSY